MQEHFLEVKKTARYFSSGNATAKNLLVVLHGYGQLPYYFIRKFAHLDENWFVVAPEGLHRFYTNGSSGRVGASWMTKEARELDIQDNLEWMEQLMKTISAQHSYEKIVLLGFSQGAATAARYFYSTSNPINQLIIWASVFPSDIPKEQLFSTSNSEHENVFVLGNNDMYFNEEQQEEVVRFFRSINFETVQFEGNHDIDAKTLEDILQKV